MMMHTTLAQLRTLKLDGLAAGLEEQLSPARHGRHELRGAPGAAGRPGSPLPQ